MTPLDTTRDRLAAFVRACDAGQDAFRLTPQAEPTPYARCFAVYAWRLLKDPQLQQRSAALAQAIVTDMRAFRARPGMDVKGKPYRQLLTFSLSALAALPGSSPGLLDDLVAEQLAGDPVRDLEALGCLAGRAGSGNQAMFIAIFLLHGRDRLGQATQPQIDRWVDQHLRHMNRFGFWGADRHMTHLQFQNGYHQHEVLEYLGVDHPRIADAVAAVRGLADAKGHFAPYPGGGGCFDYDAVFMLTPHGRVPDEATRAQLLRTAATIAAEQRPDGGFAESVHVRPRSPASLRGFAAHILQARGNRALFAERLRQGLTLQRPKHDRIHTHWSRYSRRWDEADLWDSWFRMLALARIDVAMDPQRAGDWGFIDYPGIGYHPSLAAGPGRH